MSDCHRVLAALFGKCQAALAFLREAALLLRRPRPERCSTGLTSGET